MRPDEITLLYDAAYAAQYEANFLTSPLTSADASYELELLASLITKDASWLDVACGTGYFMRHFPKVKRTGLDLSRAMLAIAQASNPSAEFIEGTYLDARTEWLDRFDLVSCMWYAYGFVETIDDLLRLIKNLAAWTSRDGTCFVPLADPQLMTGYPLTSELNNGGNAGDVSLTGIIWSYSEQGGAKVHKNLLAPLPEFMIEAFANYFDDVKLIRYPPAFPGWTGRPAIVASKKLSP